jgi:hypothetical protein
VNEANVFKKEEKLPCWSAGMLSSVLLSVWVMMSFMI